MAGGLNLDGLALLPGRCQHGFHVTQRTLCEDCTPSEWSLFRTAVLSVVRDDGTVHQGDVRPLIRGRIAPKHIGSLYRRARSEGLLVDTGQLEPSTDAAGRNTDKQSRIYRVAA